jgi:pimeloyl-ACP methyl ester carboxylesterase
MYHSVMRTKLAMERIKPHKETLSLGTMHYLRGGSGFPLVFVHGFGTHSLENWGPHMGSFRHSFQVYAPDLFWFGKSLPDKASTVGTPEQQADAIVALLRKQGVTKAHVVGASFGGYVALCMAIRHPGFVHKLVVSDSAGMAPTEMERASINKAFAHVGGDIRKLLVPSSIDLIRKSMPLMMYQPPPIPDFVLRDMLKSGLKHQKAYARLASHLAKSSLSKAALRTIDSETLILWGKHDRLLPLTMGLRMSRAIPRSRFLLFHRSGHNVMGEEPFRYRKVLKQFLR